MTRILDDIAYVRAGDKGDTISIGVLAKSPELYPLVLQSLDAKTIKDLFGAWVEGAVEIFPMANIDGCLVLLNGMSGGGATKTLRYDATGKALGSALLRLPVVGDK